MIGKRLRSASVLSCLQGFAGPPKLLNATSVQEIAAREHTGQWFIPI